MFRALCTMTFQGGALMQATAATYVVAVVLAFLAAPASAALVSPLDLPIMMRWRELYNRTRPEVLLWRPEADCTTWPRVQCDGARVSKLDFMGCQLGGPMPEFVTGLSALRLFYADGNGFTGRFPESFSNLRSLQLIRLNGNRLEGQLPAGFSVLRSLYKFHVGGNLNMTGNVPDTWSSLNLQEFYVDNNQFSGPFPTVLCNWPGLQQLHIGGNPWTGGLPECMSRNTQLLNFYVDNSGTLGGTMPSGLGNVRSLQRLYVNGNNISGPIPSTYGNLANLEAFFLSGTPITGPLPDSLGRLTKLTALVMEFCRVDGTIPSTFGNMSSLQRLLLDNNRLTGQIPASLGNLKQLTILLLEGNGLTGRVPPEIPAGCSRLVQFNVESNSLTGIPPGGFSSPAIWQVNYRSNLLSGTPNFTRADGTRFCPAYWPNAWIHSSVAFNCFQANATGCSSNDLEMRSYQRPSATCAYYCGANRPEGACGGKGYCTLDATCICDPGFVRSTNGSTCVPATPARILATTLADGTAARLDGNAADILKAEVASSGGGTIVSQALAEPQEVRAICAMGMPAKCGLECSDYAGFGCSCATGASINTPYCRYNRMCLDLSACPVASTCAESGGKVTCSCQQGYRPIKGKGDDSSFPICGKTKCSSTQAFVGFSCSSRDGLAR